MKSKSVFICRYDLIYSKFYRLQPEKLLELIKKYYKAE